MQRKPPRWRLYHNKTSQKATRPQQLEAQAEVRSTSERIKISPLARKMAQEKSYDISQIKGTGEDGRIIKRDIEAFVPSTTAPVYATEEPTVAFEDIKISQMRKTIANRLSESKFTSPHFYLNTTVDMDRAIAARKLMNEASPSKISFNDLIIKAVALSLSNHPDVNTSWLGDSIRYNKHINIGVAVAVPDGLVVPVVRNADKKNLSSIASEVKTLGQQAKDKTLKPEQWQGSTFTISNLGMFGVDDFTAIINPPDACILAVGAIKQVPVVKDGEIKVGNQMRLTLSCDHRLVDGAVGAQFLQQVRRLLEAPVQMLV